jgi:adenylosuccinate lyase
MKGGIKMIPRYENPDISIIWSNETKLGLWLKTELAAIEARANLGLIERSVSEKISEILLSKSIDIEWWLNRDKEISHDLNAFLDERFRFLPLELQRYFHDGMTSYDTEEAAFASMLSKSVELLRESIFSVKEALKFLAHRYRYTVMNGRTHGQWANLQSFGKRCLTWLVELEAGERTLEKAAGNLAYSRLSGAIGNYGGLDAEIEKEALEILGFKPFYGATQIMPRSLYAPLAEAICQIVQIIGKIAMDIRLGARSGRPIYQEPFGKKQKGSSAMPHKKNTISCEQLEGMARAALGYLNMIMLNIPTWEERSIEQSSVERIAWPDMFHVALNATKVITRVLGKLTVFPDNMLKEIIDSRGCYAASEAKEFLREHGSKYGLSAEDAYRIVQLAAFNAFSPSFNEREMRKNPPDSFTDAMKCMKLVESDSRYESNARNIRTIILRGELTVSDQLDIDEDTVGRHNSILKKMFRRADILDAWDRVFDLSYLLKGEDVLFKEILGE